MSDKTYQRILYLIVIPLSNLSRSGLGTCRIRSIWAYLLTWADITYQFVRSSNHCCGCLSWYPFSNLL